MKRRLGHAVQSSKRQPKAENLTNKQQLKAAAVKGGNAAFRDVHGF